MLRYPTFNFSGEAITSKKLNKLKVEEEKSTPGHRLDNKVKDRIQLSLEVDSPSKIISNSVEAGYESDITLPPGDDELNAGIFPYLQGVKQFLKLD